MGKTVKLNDDAVWLRIKSLKGEERGEQTKLMAFCGLAQNTYNGWNSGDLKSYRKYIDKISEFYGVSADWILTGEEQKEKSPAPEGAELTPEQIKAIEKIKNMPPDELARKMPALVAVLDM